jgi:hypothetical protein
MCPWDIPVYWIFMTKNTYFFLRWNKLRKELNAGSSEFLRNFVTQSAQKNDIKNSPDICQLIHLYIALISFRIQTAELEWFPLKDRHFEQQFEFPKSIRAILNYYQYIIDTNIKWMLTYCYIVDKKYSYFFIFLNRALSYHCYHGVWSYAWPYPTERNDAQNWNVRNCFGRQDFIFISLWM